MFTEDFLDQLPDDPYQALKLMCKEFWEINAEISEGDEDEYSREYIDAYAAIEAYIEAHGLEITLPDIGEDKSANIDLVRQIYVEINSIVDKYVMNLDLSESREKYKSRFGKIFLYQFSDGDINRIQKLLNELRDMVGESELFDANHKERILKKLEGLQGELHKKMSSLDKLWGLIGEAGVALGKFGKEVKPFTDRIREILQIVWRTQARAEELPSATPLTLLSIENPETERK